MERINVSHHLAELAEDFSRRALVETDGAKYINLAYIRDDKEIFLTVMAKDDNDNIVGEASRRYTL